MKHPILFPIYLIVSSLFFSGSSVGQQQVPQHAQLKASVVQVTMTIQQPDPNAPWRFHEVADVPHLGVVVEGGRIVTTAAVIPYERMLTMNRIGESQRHPIQLVHVDENFGLAILKPENPEVLQDMQPLRMAPDATLGQTAHLVTGRDQSRLSTAPARLHEVRVQPSPTSLYAYPQYEFVTDRESLVGYGEPLVNEYQQLVGIVLSASGANLAAVPATMIKHFIAASQQEPPGLLGYLGLGIRPLQAESMRKHYGVQSPGGVIISRRFAKGAFGESIEVGDVLLSLDGKDVDSRGYFKHSTWGPLYLSALITNRFSGDTITAKVLRKGKPVKLEGKLTPYQQRDYLIPAVAEPHIPHLIVGGLVFQELTAGYLKIWGKNWAVRAPESFVFAFRSENLPSEGGERHRIVVVSQVLADPVNFGYQSLRHARVELVNGQKVRNLKDVATALAKPRAGNRLHIIFEKGDGEVVLSYDGLKEAETRLRRSYNISVDESFWNPS